LARGRWAAIGHSARGTQADAQSSAAIHRALEPGVNWIDPGVIYGLGRSEEVSRIKLGFPADSLRMKAVNEFLQGGLFEGIERRNGKRA